MGYYRPRHSEVRTCKHCATRFQTHHKRAMYCGDSCRVLAHKARQGAKSPQAAVVEGKSDLNFSAQNVGTTAVDAGVAALGNYLLNDKPAHKRLIAKLAQVEQDTQQRFNKLDQGMQLLIDGIMALKAQNPAISEAFDRLQADRLAQAAPPPSIFMQLFQESQLKQQAKAAPDSTPTN